MIFLQFNAIIKFFKAVCILFVYKGDTYHFLVSVFENDVIYLEIVH